MFASLSAATLAGLVGSPHCIGMCGGFAAACGSGPDRGAIWQAGKLTTYMGLGALAGAVGGFLPGPSWIAAAVSGGLMVWFSLVLAGLVREPRFRVPGLTRLATRAASESGAGWRFLFGVATGFLPCGLVYAALAIPVATGSALVGALAMAGFGLGTAPALFAVSAGLRSLVMRDLRVRRVVAAGVLLAGLASIAMRQGLVGDAPHNHGAVTPGDVPAEAHLHSDG